MPEELNGSPTRRLEALTDGVFAIVMTLLVFDLSLPIITGSSVEEELPRRLLALWPTYLSYLVSFLVLGLFWLHHHALFELVKAVDGPLIWLNLIFLMFIGLIPFTSSLAARYWGEPLTAVLYGLNWLVPLHLNLLLLAHASRNPELAGIAPEFVRQERIAGAVLTLVILLGMVLSLIHSAIAFLVYLALALFYIAGVTRKREGLASKKRA